MPESQCVICRPDLLPRGKDYGWCKEHGVHNCPLHHPEVAQTKETPAYCRRIRIAPHALWPWPHERRTTLCKNYLRRIQFASLEAVKKAGVDVALVDRQPIVESIAANGQITYDQTRFASLSSRLPGTVWRVEKNVGDRVRAGEVLALVDAAEVGRAKTELIQALAEEDLQHKAVTRLDSLSTEGVVPGRQNPRGPGRPCSGAGPLAERPADARESRPAGQRRAVARSARRRPCPPSPAAWPSRITRPASQPQRDDRQLSFPYAPLDGIVVARQVVAGEVVDASRVLFQLADTSRMWLTLNVSVEDAGKLALGQPVRFRPDGSRDEVSGKLVWISTTADQQTRMVTVRAELPNPKGQLRNETFGAGRIILREEQEAIVVPNEAIHWEGCCHVVFVRDKGYLRQPG